MSVLSILILVPTADGLAPASGAPAAQTVTLTVDAAEAPGKLFRAREVIPVSPGPLTLSYPKWIPGTHGPTGPIINLSGMKFTASGKTLPWRRDPVDMYAFHLDVPQGATAVEASLEFLAPTFERGFSSTTLHLFVADSPAALEASPQFTDAMRKLVDEGKALFGAEHYEHYKFSSR